MSNNDIQFCQNMKDALSRISKDKVDHLALKLILEFLIKNDLLEHLNKNLALKNIKKFKVTFVKSNENEGSVDYVYKTVSIKNKGLPTRIHEMLHFILMDEQSTEPDFPHQKGIKNRKEEKKYKNKLYISALNLANIRWKKEEYAQIRKNKAFLNENISYGDSLMAINEGLTELITRIIYKNYNKNDDAEIYCYLSYVSLARQVYAIYGKKLLEAYFGMGIELLVEPISQEDCDKLLDALFAFDYFEDDINELTNEYLIEAKNIEVYDAQITLIKLFEKKLKTELKTYALNFKNPEKAYLATSQAFVDYAQTLYFGEYTPLETAIDNKTLWKELYKSYKACCNVINKEFGYSQEPQSYETVVHCAISNNTCNYGLVESFKEIGIKDKITIEKLEADSSPKLREVFEKYSGVPFLNNRQNEKSN